MVRKTDHTCCRRHIDAHVGIRIRKRRIAVGLTLRELGDRVHISEGQIHKFERGRNRVSAGLLYEISQALDAPISYFFEGFVDGNSISGRGDLSQTVYHFSVIQNEKHQEAFSHLVRALAEG